MKLRSAMLLTFSIGCLAYGTAAEAAPPTCASPIGSWKNELQSIMTIQSYDTATGAITGTYQSPSGGGSTNFALTGWINTNQPSGGSNSKTAIAFSVYWGKFGSITAWAGTCSNNQINALWHLTRTVSDFDWDHVLAGGDIFSPQ